LRDSILPAKHGDFETSRGIRSRLLATLWQVQVLRQRLAGARDGARDGRPALV